MLIDFDIYYYKKKLKQAKKEKERLHLEMKENDQKINKLNAMIKILKKDKG